jgi:predicted membrane-bound spermidine synthase
LFIFFISIGLGFMFIEISQMERLIVFLGHPTYGLSVVLFSLLLSSGIGSYFTQSIGKDRLRSGGLGRFILLLAAVGGFGLLTPLVTVGFRASETPVRIVVALAILFPLGLFMGMPFPLGMKLGAQRANALTSWLWGINGATSVCASVIAVAISLSFGINVSFWTGFTCYVIACVAFFKASGSSTGERKATPQVSEVSLP